MSSDKFHPRSSASEEDRAGWRTSETVMASDCLTYPSYKTARFSLPPNARRYHRFDPGRTPPRRSKKVLEISKSRFVPEVTRGRVPLRTRGIRPRGTPRQSPRHPPHPLQSTAPPDPRPPPLQPGVVAALKRPSGGDPAWTAPARLQTEQVVRSARRGENRRGPPGAGGW